MKKIILFTGLVLWFYGHSFLRLHAQETIAEQASSALKKLDVLYKRYPVPEGKTRFRWNLINELSDEELEILKKEWQLDTFEGLTIKEKCGSLIGSGYLPYDLTFAAAKEAKASSYILARVLADSVCYGHDYAGAIKIIENHNNLKLLSFENAAKWFALLGDFYWKGHGVKQDQDKARTLFKKAVIMQAPLILRQQPIKPVNSGRGTEFQDMIYDATSPTKPYKSKETIWGINEDELEAGFGDDTLGPRNWPQPFNERIEWLKNLNGEQAFKIAKHIRYGTGGYDRSPTLANQWMDMVILRYDYLPAYPTAIAWTQDKDFQQSISDEADINNYQASPLSPEFQKYVSFPRNSTRYKYSFISSRHNITLVLYSPYERGNDNAIPLINCYLEEPPYAVEERFYWLTQAERSGVLKNKKILEEHKAHLDYLRSQRFIDSSNYEILNGDTYILTSLDANAIDVSNCLRNFTPIN